MCGRYPGAGSLVLPFLMAIANHKEVVMRKLVLILLVLGLAACAKAPVKPEHSSETQRSHAHEAQGELSSEVRK